MNGVSVSVPCVHVRGFFSSLFSIRATQSTLWTNHLKYRRVGVLALFAVLVFSPLTARAKIIFSVDYDKGTFGNVSVRKNNPGAGYPSLAYQPSEGHSARIVDAPGRSGKAVKVMLLPTDKGYVYGKWMERYVRAEFEKHGLGYLGKEFWYGFSVNVDPAYRDSTAKGSGTVIAQWHTNKDSCDASVGPELSIFIVDGKWKIRGNSDAKACSTSSSVKKSFWTAGEVKKGVWVSWVVNVKWSYGSDGRLAVWKDGKQIINKTGPNAYNNTAKQKFKWGVYNGSWKNSHPMTDKLIAYFGEIKIGDASSSYAEVAPTNAKPAIALDAPENLILLNY